jgi:gamma-glutamyl-gamma-aminobutyrate hydrolase PuuD
MALIGIPTCMRTVNERIFHGVADRYPNAVIDATGCLPVLIPAVGSKVDICVLLDRLDGLLLTGSPLPTSTRANMAASRATLKRCTIRSAMRRRCR